MAHLYARPGWKEVKPRTRFERYELAKVKPECFLFPEGTPTDPGVPHYPICTRTGEISCPGLLAAYRRLMVYGKRYPPEFQPKVAEALRRIIRIAERYADPRDPQNVCNFVFRAKETLRERGFRLMGVYRHCIAWKMTRAGRRCAKYAPGPGPSVSGVGEVGELAGKYRVCVAWKMTRAGRRCAKYAPVSGAEMGELAGKYRKCVAYKMTRAGLRCAKYAPVSGAEVGEVGLGATMRPGECRVTRGGVKYCYIPGKGVRFVGES